MKSTMKSITSSEAANKFGDLVLSAQKEPVTITKQGKPALVVMSVEDFEARSTRARSRVRSILNRSQQYAQSQGLDQATLDELLADES